MPDDTGVPYPPRPDVPATPPRPDAPAFPAPGQQVVHPRRSVLKIALAAILAPLLLVAVLWIGLGSPLSGRLTNPPAGTTTPGRPSDNPSVSPADTSGIVDINTFTTRSGLRTGPEFPFGSGTGMVLTSSGQLLTNNHVIRGSTRIQVVIPGGNAYAARVMGADPTGDVALLRIQGASGLATVTVGDSNEMALADPVKAIGNAFGRGGPPDVTRGLVWELDQSILAEGPGGEVNPLAGVFEITAKTHPGDSGGAVENAAGDVIGMVTAGRKTRNGTDTRFTEAIPINTAMAVVRQIRMGRTSGDVLIGDASYLGVTVKDVDGASARRLGVSPGKGALVTRVLPGTPAGGASLSTGSVITSIGGRAIHSAGDVDPAIHARAPGERVTVMWVDGSGRHAASVVLVPGPAV